MGSRLLVFALRMPFILCFLQNYARSVRNLINRENSCYIAKVLGMTQNCIRW